MIVLDASAAIAFLSAADPHHPDAVDILSDTPAPYAMHALTVAEVLVGPARAGRELEVWDALRSIGVEVAELGPDESMLLARTRAVHALKMPDTCVLATAISLNRPVLTFDAHLAAAAARIGLLHAPA